MRTAKFTGKGALLVALVGCAVAASFGTRYGASVPSSRQNGLGESFSGASFVQLQGSFRESVQERLDSEQSFVRRESQKAWPSRLHRSARADRSWSISSVSLGLETSEFLDRVPGAAVRLVETGISRRSPDFVHGDLVGGKVTGSFDRQERVRGVQGTQLEASGVVLVCKGDSPESVERCLGSPTSAAEPWGVFRSTRTDWTYEHESTTVEVLFQDGRVWLITVRENSFLCDGPRC